MILFFIFAYLENPAKSYSTKKRILLGSPLVVINVNWNLVRIFPEQFTILGYEKDSRSSDGGARLSNLLGCWGDSNHVSSISCLDFHFHFEIFLLLSLSVCPSHAKKLPVHHISHHKVKSLALIKYLKFKTTSALKLAHTRMTWIDCLAIYLLSRGEGYTRGFFNFSSSSSRGFVLFTNEIRFISFRVEWFCDCFQRERRHFLCEFFPVWNAKCEWAHTHAMMMRWDDAEKRWGIAWASSHFHIKSHSSILFNFDFLSVSLSTQTRSNSSTSSHSKPQTNCSSCISIPETWETWRWMHNNMNWNVACTFRATWKALVKSVDFIFFICSVLIENFWFERTTTVLCCKNFSLSIPLFRMAVACTFSDV